MPQLDLPNFLAEFVFDTTRCITSLLYSGTLERYPSIRYIVAHAGGTVPYLAWRLSLGSFVPKLADAVPKGPMHYLKRLCFDTALSASPQAFSALTQLVPPSQILFGSDYPMAPEAIAAATVSGVADCPVLAADAVEAIERGSALRLFPRFAE